MQFLFLRGIRQCVAIVCYSFLTMSTAGAASCDKSFSEVFREVSPSTVRILSVAIDPFKVMERVQLGVGTGFVIDDDGHIVTNAHVVYGASEVIASDGKEQMAKAGIVGVDPVSDLAVLRLRYHLPRNLTVNFGVQNLFNEPQRYYRGVQDQLETFLIQGTSVRRGMAKYKVISNENA